MEAKPKKKSVLQTIKELVERRTSRRTHKNFTDGLDLWMFNKCDDQARLDLYAFYVVNGYVNPGVIYHAQLQTQERLKQRIEQMKREVADKAKVYHSDTQNVTPFKRPGNAQDDVPRDQNGTPYYPTPTNNAPHDTDPNKKS